MEVKEGQETASKGQEEVVTNEDVSKNGCCSFLRFEGVDAAKGYNWVRGAITQIKKDLVIV